MLAADTLSIVTMEVVDNLVMVAVPGAMDAGLVNPVFWLAMMLALGRLRRGLPGQPLPARQGKGHALTHGLHEGGPLMNTHTLAAGIVGFLLGGLTVSVAAELEDEPAPAPQHGVGP